MRHKKDIIRLLEIERQKKTFEGIVYVFVMLGGFSMGKQHKKPLTATGWHDLPQRWRIFEEIREGFPIVQTRGMVIRGLWPEP